MAPPKLGILAGGGAIPTRLAQTCRQAGREVYVLGIDGSVSGDCPIDQGVSIAAAGRVFDLFEAAGCRDVVLVGNVRRPDFATLKPDWLGLRLMPGIVAAAARGDDHLLRHLVSVFEGRGFRVVGAQDVMATLLLPAGPLGRLDLPESCAGDLARARQVVRVLGRVDVGQGAVVVKGDVLAVEAAEGTDRMLARVADLRAGWSSRDGLLLKLPKPQQDRRTDLPTLGVATVEGAARAGLAGIAARAGQTLVVDRAAVAEAADRAGLFVVGLSP